MDTLLLIVRRAVALRPNRSIAHGDAANLVFLNLVKHLFRLPLFYEGAVVFREGERSEGGEWVTPTVADIVSKVWCVDSV